MGYHPFSQGEEGFVAKYFPEFGTSIEVIQLCLDASISTVSLNLSDDKNLEK